MDPISVGNRLRAARERSGLSQQEVADHLGLQRPAVTLIESGKRQVSTTELAQLATLYRRSISELLEESEQFEEDYAVVLHRGAPELRNDPQAKIDVENCLTRCRLGIELERMLGRPPRQGPPKFSQAAPKNPAEAVTQGLEVAEEERRRLGLGSAPIRNIVECINGQGVWSVTTKLSSNMAGLFMRHPDIGLVTIANGHHPFPRRRFSHAHEYGHVLMDQDRVVQVSTMGNSEDLVEIRANAFAGAFLLPPGGVRHFLANLDKGRSTRKQQYVYDVASNGNLDIESREAPNSQTITYQDAALLANSYGVSYEAAVYQLNILSFLDRTETQILRSKSGLAKRYLELFGRAPNDELDPDRDGPELSGQILYLAMEAFRREEISRGRLLDIGLELKLPAKDLLLLVDIEQELA